MHQGDAVKKRSGTLPHAVPVITNDHPLSGPAELIDDVGEGDSDVRGDRQFVVALSRGLDILRAYRPGDSALTIAELTQRSGLHAPAVKRLTHTLTKLGYLEACDGGSRYRMGIPVLGLGYDCLSGMKISETAQPYLQELADYGGNGMVTGLGSRDNLSMVFLACARSPGVISVRFHAGARLSMARSAIGRAYLAGLDEERREPLMRKLRDRSGEDAWPAIHAAIQRSIAEVRDQGFCVNLGEWDSQVSSVAVPYRPGLGDGTVLAFNCGGPTGSMSPERLIRDLGPRLVELVDKIAVFGHLTL